VHKQTWVKVNAPVDEGVAGLVSALSSFPELCTIESCQGDAEHPAVVFYSYADKGVEGEHSWQKLSEFTLGFLGPRLVQQLGDLVTMGITINSWGWPQGELQVRPGAMQRTLRAIKQARKEFKG